MKTLNEKKFIELYQKGKGKEICINLKGEMSLQNAVKPTEIVKSARLLSAKGGTNYKEDYVSADNVYSFLQKTGAMYFYASEIVTRLENLKKKYKHKIHISQEYGIITFANKVGSFRYDIQYMKYGGNLDIELKGINVKENHLKVLTKIEEEVSELRECWKQVSSIVKSVEKNINK